MHGSWVVTGLQAQVAESVQRLDMLRAEVEHRVEGAFKLTGAGRRSGEARAGQSRVREGGESEGPAACRTLRIRTAVSAPPPFAHNTRTQA